MEFFSENKNGLFVLAFCIYSIVFTLMPPPMEHYMQKYRLEENAHPWKALSENINGTYRSENYDPYLHESKLTFRKVPALLGKLSPSKDRYVQVFFLYCLQLIMGLLFTVFVLQWLMSVTGDIAHSALLTLGLMLTHIGSSFTYDLSFFFDGMAFFFLALALFSTTSFPFLVGTTAALWTDERAVIGVAGVLLFKWITTDSLSSLRGVFFNRYTLLILLVLVTYILMRVYMTVFLHLTVPLGEEAAVGLSEWGRHVKEMPIAWLLTFKLYWYYTVPLLIYLLQRSVTVGLSIGVFLVLSLFATGLVIDIMRSATFLYPFVICGMYCSYKLFKPEKVALLGRINAIWNIVIPNYRGFEIFYLIIPLPFRILRYFL